MAPAANGTQPVQAVNGTLPAANLTLPAAPFQNQTGFTSTLISTEVTDVTTTISLLDSVVTSVIQVSSTHTVFVHYTATNGGSFVRVSSTAVPAATPAAPIGNNAQPTPVGGSGSEPTTTLLSTEIITRTATVTLTRQVQSAGGDQQKGVTAGIDDSDTTTTVDITVTQTTTVNPLGTAAPANNNNAAGGCGGAPIAAPAAGAIAGPAAPSVVTVTEKATVTLVSHIPNPRDHKLMLI
jgi:hypothetical protein